MQINITVDDLDSIDLTTVIAETISYDEDGGRIAEGITLGERVAKLIAANLTRDDQYKTLRQRYLELRDEAIREQVTPIVAEAISGPIRLTNSYGEPTGPETTLNALIVDAAKKVIGGDRKDYGRGDTLAQRIVKDAVGAALNNELGKVVAEEKAKVVAAVRAKAADLIAEAVKQGVGR